MTVISRLRGTACAILALALLTFGSGCSENKEHLKYQNEIKQRGLAFEMGDFFDHIKSGNKETVELFIKAGMDVNKKHLSRASNSYSGKTALMVASNRGNLEMVKILIAHGADIHARFKSSRGPRMEGHTPLVFAAQEGNTDVVRYLLEKKADVNARVYPSGRTALIYACENGHTDVARELLKSGADVAIPFEGERDSAYEMWMEEAQPLMIAAFYKRNEIVKLLIENGADINAQRIYDGRSALMLAIDDGNTELAKLLIANKADLNIKDSKGRTPFILAIDRKRPQFAAMLKNAGAGIHYEIEQEEMVVSIEAFFDSIKEGNRGKAERLIKAGINVNRKFTGSQGGHSGLMTAIMIASGKGDLEMVKMLVAHGADINAAFSSSRGPQIQGQTPLMFAAIDGHAGVVRYLLEKKADVNSRTQPHNRTALIYACENGHAEVARELLRNGADISVPFKGTSATSLRGTGISSYDEEMKGATAFMIGAYRNRNKICQLLMEKGADVNERRRYDGRTALMLAIENGNADLAHLLINAKADVSIKDAKGKTPLMLAVEKKQGRIESMLKKAGAR